MKRIQGSDITVTKDDQVQINTFSKLYSKNQDNEALLAALNEKISQHKDTLDELELNNDDDFTLESICYFIFSIKSSNIC